MAEALLFSTVRLSQEFPFRCRHDGECGSGGVSGFWQISAWRECPSYTRVFAQAGSKFSGGSKSPKCWKRVRAGVSQPRISQLVPSKNEIRVIWSWRTKFTRLEPASSCKFSSTRRVDDEKLDMLPTDLGELNLPEDASCGKAERTHAKLLQERNVLVLDVFANDVEVIPEGVDSVEQKMLLLNADAESGMLINSSLDFNADDGLFAESDISLEAETAAILPQRPARYSIILARDGKFIQESISSLVKAFEGVFFLAEEESVGVGEGHLSAEFQNRKSSALGKIQEIHNALAQAGEKLVNFADIIGKRTGVGKTVQRDAEFTRDGINLLKEEVVEALRMRRGEEDTFSVAEFRPWPEPAYFGLSGKDLLAADVEALNSYGNCVRGFFNMWRIPLQLSYDPEAVASYFNRRPHLLFARVVEVSAASSGVALQRLLDGHYTLQNAEALKQTLLKLGPTFIKVAQSLSSRPDLIGTETAKVLSELQDRLPPFSTEEAMAVIELDLGVPASQVFSYLSTTPVAAASFGQVYKGYTSKGEEVAVKVQRPDLLLHVALDVYVLRLGLKMLRKVARMNSDLSLLADEFGYALFGELDYTLEAANANEFGASLRHLSYIKIPKTLPHLTSKRVLTMEWITGYRPLDLQLIAEGDELNGSLAAGIDCQGAKFYLDDLVRKGVECSLVQLLETGIMHADPHPGNLLYTREGILVYLDFGLLARVNKKHQAAMLAAIAHLINGEWQCLANDFADLGILKPSTDRFALRLEFERVLGQGPDAIVKNEVSDIQFGQLTGKLWRIALKFRFRLPPYYTLVLRALATLEGIALSVDPDYKVFGAAYPYVIRWLLKDNSHPGRQVLQSLVLNEKRGLRWERIVKIMATSRGGSSVSVKQVTANPPQPNPHGLQLRNGVEISSTEILSFVLSRDGTSVRRVLLEADTKSLAEALFSPSASLLRRKMSLALAKSFYFSLSNFRGTTSKGTSSRLAGFGYVEGKTISSVESSRQGIPNEFSSLDMQSIVYGENNSQLSMEPSLNYHRFWFLLKVLLFRLRRSPILMSRVIWAGIQMVAIAATVALHQYCITVGDRLLGAKANKVLDTI